MTNIICNLDNFVQYIHDSSAAIFSEERNRAHDWYKKIYCGFFHEEINIVFDTSVIKRLSTTKVEINSQSQPA